MQLLCLLFFLAAIVNAKLTAIDREISNATCVMDTDFYWNAFAVHFGDASLIQINILHTDAHHNNMSHFVNVVFKYAHVFTKLQKPVCVKHTHLLVVEERRGDVFIEGNSGYIIIVWDHVVLSDFLDLIPAEVVGKRRGKYLILFACNLFDGEDVLARFWKQFGVVNVCACNCRGNVIYQYQPFLQKIHELDVGVLHEKPDALTVSMKDFHQYPLKVSMFERQPTAILFENDPLMKFFPKTLINHSIYTGVDGLVMETLSQYLNFRLVFKETDYFKYGRILENGTAVGSLGDVVYRRVHIAGNGRFMEHYGVDDAVEFSLPYQSDFVCFSVPKSQKIPQWILLFHCFTPLVWFAFFTTFLLACLIWKALQGNYLTFYAIFSNTSTTFISLTPTQKLFLVFCLCYNLIMNGVFQSTLTTSFSTVSYYADITTLEALAKSDLTISSNVDVFKNDNNSVAAILKTKQKPTNGDWALQRAALKRDVAAVERRLDAKYYIQKYFLDENGSPLVHIVEECVTSNFIAFLVPKGSPFLEMFNIVIAMLNEAGFSKKWYDDIAGNPIFTRRSISLRSKDDKKALNFNDIQSAFYILAFGLGVSFFVFLGELWQKRRMRHNFFLLIE